MIRFQAFGVRFTLPLLTLLFPFLAIHLGLDNGIWALLLALGAHELAHVTAAAALGVQIQEIRLMPFGGSARMENPYGVPAGRMLGVAAAGPMVNLALAVLISALAQWNIVSAHTALQHARHNLILCCFNLLPALPLDGGRMLYALLQRRTGEEKALRLGLWMGRFLASVLIFIAAAGGIMRGKWNLSFFLAAVFLLSSGVEEHRALIRSRAQRFLTLQKRQEGPLPVRIYQSGDLCVRDALALLRPRERVWFADAAGKIITDHSILAHILKNGAADLPLGDLPLQDSAAPRLDVRNSGYDRCGSAPLQ